MGRAALGRAGRAALLATGRTPVPDALEPLVQAHRRHHPQADLGLLGRAYRLAEASHRGQKRKSGEPYITHPLAVTMILAQLGAGTTTLVSSLLHDTVEDTELTLAQVSEEFGPEVAYLVDGVTKLEKVDFGAAAEAETFRKMLVATGDDVRVMVIKLADRLHNMRTIRHMKPASRIRIAKVTRDVLIPLAERLGIQVLKAELEDIVFATLHPEEHARTRALLAGHETVPDALFEPFARTLARQLAEAGVAAEVTVRPRHCVSLHRVLLKRAAAPGRDGQPQEPQPADFGRLLVVVEENADCYAVLGELHTCWTPLPGEFKDFVAAPKFNLYQSLHTAVALAGGEVVEVLVRTRRMHEIAETGVVALGDPRQPGANGSDQAGDELDRTDPARPGWLSRLLEWQQETPDPDAFWSALTADLAGDREITVVTESGETLQLRAGASCVDAAYLLGEETGHRCIGARVNGRLTALSTVLQDGDRVAILTEQGDPAARPRARPPNGSRTPGRPPPGWPSNAGWPTPGAAAGGPRRPRRRRPAGPARTPDRRTRRRPGGGGRPARGGGPAGPLLHPGAAGRGQRLRDPRRRRRRAPHRLPGRGADARGRARRAGDPLAARRRTAGRLPGHAAGRGAQPAPAAGRPHRGDLGGGGRDRLGGGRAAAGAAGAAHLHRRAARAGRAGRGDAGDAAGLGGVRRGPPARPGGRWHARPGGGGGGGRCRIGPGPRRRARRGGRPGARRGPRAAAGHGKWGCPARTGRATIVGNSRPVRGVHRAMRSTPVWGRGPEG